MSSQLDWSDLLFSLRVCGDDSPLKMTGALRTLCRYRLATASLAAALGENLAGRWFDRPFFFLVQTWNTKELESCVTFWWTNIVIEKSHGNTWCTCEGWYFFHSYVCLPKCKWYFPQSWWSFELIQIKDVTDDYNFAVNNQVDRGSLIFLQSICFVCMCMFGSLICI